MQIIHIRAQNGTTNRRASKHAETHTSKPHPHSRANQTSILRQTDEDTRWQRDERAAEETVEDAEDDDAGDVGYGE